MNSEKEFDREFNLDEIIKTVINEDEELLKRLEKDES